MTSNQAIQMLEPIIPVFRQAWVEAWDEVRDLLHPEYDNRTRTSLLHMHAVMRAKALTYGGTIGYRCVETRHLFLVGESAVLRLKKLDDQHIARNYPTETSEKIYRQEGLPGLEDRPWLTVGLVPNKDWTDYAGIYLTYPRHSGANNWVVNITAQPQDIDKLQNNFDESLNESTRRRFRPKRDGDDRQAGADGKGV
jgi:hypothetical protein